MVMADAVDDGHVTRPSRIASETGDGYVDCRDIERTGNPGYARRPPIRGRPLRKPMVILPPRHARDYVLDDVVQPL